MRKEKGEIFYVYIYLDPRKPGSYSYSGLNNNRYVFEYEPFYVGKGKDSQYLSHIKEATGNNKKIWNPLKTNKIKKIIGEYGCFPIIIKIKENLNESDSFNLEKNTIKTIGRLNIDNGPLTNLTNGGDGVSGFLYSEEWKKWNRERFVGKKSPLYGKKGSLHPSYGYKHTDEWKKQMSLIRKGKTFGPPSEQTRKKLSESHKGKIVSNSTKEKLRLLNKGKTLSIEHKRKISESHKGKKKGKIKVTINGIYYESIKSAADAIGISTETVTMRIKRKYNGYKYT